MKNFLTGFKYPILGAGVFAILLIAQWLINSHTSSGILLIVLLLAIISGTFYSIAQHFISKKENINEDS